MFAELEVEEKTNTLQLPDFSQMNLQLVSVGLALNLRWLTITVSERLLLLEPVRIGYRDRKAIAYVFTTSDFAIGK